MWLPLHIYVCLPCLGAAIYNLATLGFCIPRAALPSRKGMLFDCGEGLTFCTISFLKNQICHHPHPLSLFNAFQGLLYFPHPSLRKSDDYNKLRYKAADSPAAPASDQVRNMINWHPSLIVRPVCVLVNHRTHTEGMFTDCNSPELVSPLFGRLCCHPLTDM